MACWGAMSVFTLFRIGSFNCSDGIRAYGYHGMASHEIPRQHGNPKRDILRRRRRDMHVWQDAALGALYVPAVQPDMVRDSQAHAGKGSRSTSAHDTEDRGGSFQCSPGTPLYQKSQSRDDQVLWSLFFVRHIFLRCMFGSLRGWQGAACILSAYRQRERMAGRKGHASEGVLSLEGEKDSDSGPPTRMEIMHATETK
jgi:hypothetical protein